MPTVTSIVITEHIKLFPTRQDKNLKTSRSDFTRSADIYGLVLSLIPGFVLTVSLFRLFYVQFRQVHTIYLRVIPGMVDEYR